MALILKRLWLVALPLYFAWEMLQVPAFRGLPESWLLATALCALATLGDGILVAGLFGLGIRLFGNRRWFIPPRLGRYAAITVAGVLVQIGLEWLAVEVLGLWDYRSWQPRLPVTGTGVVALGQPLILLPLAFWLLARWDRQINLQRDTERAAGAGRAARCGPAP